MRFIGLIGAALLVAGLAACGGEHKGDSLMISDGYVRVPPRAATVAAGYFTLHNPTRQSYTVLSVSSPDFQRVEMHETVMQDGMMAMNELPRVAVPPKTVLAFKPGGNHLMLFGATEAITEGAEYRFTFELEGGEQRNVTFVGLPFGESLGGGHEGHEGH